MRLKRIAARLRSEERGAALVEFALVVPLLMAMMCIIIDFGLALHTLNNLTSALREGARYGAVLPLPGPTVDDTRIRDRVIAYMSSYGGNTLTPGSISVTLPTEASGVKNVKVTVSSFTYTPVTPLAPLFGMGTMTFTRSAVYRYEFQ
jgi:Flp pilus assembly protein TadG